MKLKDGGRTAIAVGGNGRRAVTALVITTESGQLRRRLGPLAWMVLQHLALNCCCMEGGGWAAAVGVREIASGVGVTKDTAARGVSTLLSAGLVTRELIDLDAKRRPGYQLHLPAGMRLIGSPEQSDRTDRGGPARPNLDLAGRPWCEPGRLEEEDIQEGPGRPGRRGNPAASGERMGIHRPYSMRHAQAIGEPPSALSELSAGARHD
jgi:hypothetical protein